MHIHLSLGYDPDYSQTFGMTAMEEDDRAFGLFLLHGAISARTENPSKVENQGWLSLGRHEVQWL